VLITTLPLVCARPTGSLPRPFAQHQNKIAHHLTTRLALGPQTATDFRRRPLLPAVGLTWIKVGFSAAGAA